MNRPIKRFDQISTQVPAGSTATKINIGDIPELRSDITKDIVIRELQVYTAASMPNDYNGNPLPTLAQLLNISITLYVEGEESLFRIPLIKLLATRDNIANDLYADSVVEFQDLMVDWTKSYYSFAVPPVPGTAFWISTSVAYKRYDPGTVAAWQKKAGLACYNPATGWM
jgi:hypothetical protein